MTYDVIVRNGLWFDGTGARPQRRTLGIRDGIVAAVSTEPLDETGCPDVIDAEGKWILPGFIDVHTHYDAEVLLDPGLRESVRHGVTTLLLGNCSLSTVYANSEDAADLFSRVEAVPRKFVLGALEAKKTWTSPAEYVQTLDDLPLGPNVSSMLGHSDLRTSVLGLERATTEGVEPTDAELERMADIARRGARRGPARHVRYGCGDRQARRRPVPVPRPAVDVRHLARTPQADQGAAQARSHPAERAQHQEPAGGVELLPHQQPDVRPQAGVRMSLLVSADAKSNAGAVHVFGPGTRILNRLFNSFVRFQHLPVPFELYSDGIDLPVFEEFGAGTAALHLRDQLERNELLADPEYRRRFRASFDRKKLGPTLWHRDFHDATIVECPDATLIGKSFGQIADERGVHPLDAFLDVLVENGERNVRWTTIVANHRPKHLNALADRPVGAHGLLRCRSAPAQHGVLQLRREAASAGPRRRARRKAVHDRRARRAPAHRRGRRMVRPATRARCAKVTAPTSSSSTRPASTTRWTATTRRRCRSTATCPAW